jgi:hypothetical protein
MDHGADGNQTVAKLDGLLRASEQRYLERVADLAQIMQEQGKSSMPAIPYFADRDEKRRKSVAIIIAYQASQQSKRPTERPATEEISDQYSAFRPGRSPAQPPPRCPANETTDQHAAFRPKPSVPQRANETGIESVIILKAGSRPVDEIWYIGQVIESIGLSLTTLSGVHIDMRYVTPDQLDHAYIMGLVMALGHDVGNCTLTPFADRDGGRGMVVKVFARAIGRSESLLDKYVDQLPRMSDAERAAIIRGTDAEKTAAMLEALTSYSGEVQLQTLLAAIDHLATGPDSSRQLAMQLLVAKDSLPSAAWKIAYEMRERALLEGELAMPASRFVEEFRKTPPWGKSRAESALEFVRRFFDHSPYGRDEFEERYACFNRSAPLVTDAEYQARSQNKLLCRQCGQPMTTHPQGQYVKLRCERCDITRFEKAGDV